MRKEAKMKVVELLPLYMLFNKCNAFNIGTPKPFVITITS